MEAPASVSGTKRGRDRDEDEDGDGPPPHQQPQPQPQPQLAKLPSVQIAKSRAFGNLLSHLGRAKNDQLGATAVRKPPPAAPAPAPAPASAPAPAPAPRPVQSSQLALGQSVITKQISEVRGQLADFEAEFGPRSQLLATHTEPRLLWLPRNHSQSTLAALSSRKADYAKELTRRQQQARERESELEKRLAERER